MIIDRILKIIELRNINKSTFYKETGLSNGFLDKVKDVGTSKLEYILKTYPEINPAWLVTGEGEMLKKDNETPNHLPSVGKTIPLIPLDAMAGFGNGDVAVMDYELEKYCVPEFDQLKVDYMIRVKGSSMIPKYNSGDIVACRQLSKNDIFFQWHKVYVLDTIQGALIKRIEPSERDGCIQLVSENEKYKPFDLNIDTEIHAIALVVGVIRFE